MKPILLNIPESFDSERLTIRVPREGDGEIVYNAVMASINELKEWLPFANYEQSIENTEENLREAIANFVLKKSMRLLLFKKGTNEVIGSSGLHNIDWDVPRFEIGYWVKTEFAGQGYITEAVERIAEFAFKDLGAKRVEIRCDEQNIKSRKIPEKLHFALEGILKNDSLHAETEELTSTAVYARYEW